MIAEPYGTTIFCDDIRHEVNGKLTLVGCYSAVLNFNGPAPGLLPTFAALVNIRIPKLINFNTIKLRVLKEGGSEVDEIFEMEVGVDEKAKRAAFEGEDTKNKEEKILSMTFPLQWSPLEVKKSGFIKVRAHLDDGKEIRLGALKINFIDKSFNQKKP